MITQKMEFKCSVAGCASATTRELFFASITDSFPRPSLPGGWLEVQPYGVICGKHEIKIIDLDPQLSPERETVVRVHG